MRALDCVVLGCLLAAPAGAQKTIDELFGSSADDRFGAAVAFVGDLDHDGKEDFVVGVPGDDSAGADAGRIIAYSGADRSVLFRANGLAPGGRLGESVDGVGDIDRDGVGDVIAGAPGASQVLVCSGVSGAVLFNLAPGSGGEFGTSVAGIGFADGDAWPDFAVGAKSGTGLWVFSGKTGSLHWSDPTVALDLGGLGDVDGDGFDDLVAGDHTYNGNGGRVVIFSGLAGAVVRQHTGNSTFDDHLGKGASGLGDIDGDKVGDYGYGVPCNCFAAHYAEVRSGATGGLIHTLTEHTLGWDVAPAGDLDLDGTPDILVSEPGLIHAFAGADGTELFSFGSAEVVDGGADADGDGFVDFLGGAPSDSTAGSNAGRVSLYTLECPFPPPEPYCTAKTNSLGCVPTISSAGTPSATQPVAFRIRAKNVINNKVGLLIYGYAPAAIPFQGGTLCLAPPIQRTDPQSSAGNPPPLDCSGVYSFEFNDLIRSGKDVMLVPGQQVFTQYWSRDKNSPPAGTGLTDALAFVICP